MSKTDQELYQLADTFQKQTGQRVFRAALGDGNGRVDVPGYNGVMVYVRYYTATGLSQPFEVAWRAGSMTKTPGTGVIVEYDYDKSLAIKRADYPAMAAQGTNPTINNPADPNNSYYIQQMRLLTFASHPVSSAADSMLVAVQTGTVIDLDADTLTLFAGEQVDLTSYIPGGAGEWCLACLFWKTDNTIEVFTSTPVTNPDLLGIADVNECIAARTAGSLPIWAWRLYNGQTGIAAGAPANGGDDFLDLRPLFFMLQSGGSGTSIAVTDGTTTVDPTTEIDFDPTYFDVTSPGGDVAGVTGSTDLGKTIAALAAKFLLQQSNANLPNAQAMGALATGLVKNTTTTGVQSIAAAGTDYTSPTGTENLSNKTITASSLVATALSLLIGGFKAIFSHANTADRTYTFPDSDGHVAMLENVYMFRPVVNVYATNQNIASPGVISTTGDRILLTGQSTGSQNGIWIYNGSSSALTRPTDYASGSTFQAKQDMLVTVTGTTGNDSPKAKGLFYRLTTSGTITIDTTATAWSLNGFSSPEITNFGNATHNHQSGSAGGTLSAAAIASGTLDAARIPNLSASIITSGTFDEARIPHKVAILQYVVAQGTNGGTPTANAWTARPLNTITSDPSSIISGSISSNQFTPVAGTYQLRAYCSMFATTGNYRHRLRNATAGSTPTGGVSPNGRLGNGGAAAGEIGTLEVPTFTANGTDAYEIDYYVSQATANTGLGVAMNVTGESEIFLTIILEKVG